MSGINKVIIIGNLGRDPELSYTNSGTAVCKMTVATTRVWNNKQTNEKQQETEWHRVTVWNQSAEHCHKYLAKGRQVYIEGRLRTSSYDKEDSGGQIQKHFSTEIVAEQVQFLGGNPDKDSSAGGEHERENGSDRNNNNDNSSKKTSGYGGGSRKSDPDEFDDDDIPF